MKDSTIAYIRKLTTADTKNLSQKALKVCEEAGELASEILPFESAHATTHRFSTKEKILEEVADVYLTSISVAFDLGFTYDDFEAMVERKTLKWAELQQRHTAAKFPVPYEIHITVKNVNQKEFRRVCRALNVKPIVLALQVGQEELEDVMTSSKHFGNNPSAYQEMKRISSGLVRSGFNVVREKIETVPWHPGAPSEKHANPTMPKDCYFETHMGVFVQTDGSPTANEKELRLRNFADSIGVHLSRNAFKILDGGYVQMITYRKYDGVYEDFKKQSEELAAQLRQAGFDVQYEVTEFSIYDTRVSHDAAWISGE